MCHLFPAGILMDTMAFSVSQKPRWENNLSSEIRVKTMLYILLIPPKWYHNRAVKGHMHKYFPNNITCYHLQILPENSTFHFFAKLWWLCGTTLNGTANWGIQSNSRGFCPCEVAPTWHRELSKCSRSVTHVGEMLFASLFYLDWLTRFFTRYFSQLQKGVIQKIFLKFIHLQGFCCFHGNFSPKPQLQILLKTSSQNSLQALKFYYKKLLI